MSSDWELYPRGKNFKGESLFHISLVVGSSTSNIVALTRLMETIKESPVLSTVKRVDLESICITPGHLSAMLIA